MPGSICVSGGTIDCGYNIVPAPSFTLYPIIAPSFNTGFLIVCGYTRCFLRRGGVSSPGITFNVTTWLPILVFSPMTLSPK